MVEEEGRAMVVTALECFADSNVAYSTGSDGFVRIIDMKNGHTIRAVPASSSTITNLAVLRQTVVASDARHLPIALYSTSNGNLFAYNGEYGSVDRVSSTNLTPLTAIKVSSMSTEQGRAVTSRQRRLLRFAGHRALKSACSVRTNFPATVRTTYS